MTTSTDRAAHRRLHAVRIASVSWADVPIAADPRVARLGRVVLATAFVVAILATAIALRLG